MATPEQIVEAYAHVLPLLDRQLDAGSLLDRIRIRGEPVGLVHRDLCRHRFRIAPNVARLAVTDCSEGGTGILRQADAELVRANLQFVGAVAIGHSL